MAEDSTLSSCLKKQAEIRNFFQACTTPDQKYQKIIELGRNLAPYPQAFKTSDYIVSGCQSIMYLHAELVNGKIQLHASSEALISAGLAALLISVYHDEPPEAVITCPPLFLEQLGITASLSPSRSNGLASLYQKIQKEAINFLLIKSKKQK